MAIAISRADFGFDVATTWFNPQAASPLERLATAWLSLDSALLPQGNPAAPLKEDAMLHGLVLERLDRERELEAAFAVLASRRGVRATSSGRALATHQWITWGEFGASWLARRIASETDDEAAHAGAEVLSAFGKVGVDAILAHLEPLPPKDFRAELLEALAWAGPEDRRSTRVRILSLLDRAVSADARPSVREAAVRAARILPPEEAVPFLTSRRYAFAHLDEEIEAAFAELS